MKVFIFLLIISFISFANAKVVEKQEVIINFSEYINLKRFKLKSYNKFIEKFDDLNPDLYRLSSVMANNIIIKELNIVNMQDRNYNFEIGRLIFSIEKKELIVTYFELFFAYGQKTSSTPLKVIMHNVYITDEDFYYYGKIL